MKSNQTKINSFHQLADFGTFNYNFFYQFHFTYVNKIRISTPYSECHSLAAVNFQQHNTQQWLLNVGWLQHARTHIILIKIVVFEKEEMAMRYNIAVRVLYPLGLGPIVFLGAISQMKYQFQSSFDVFVRTI